MDTSYMISRMFDGVDIEPEEGQQMIDRMAALSLDGKEALNAAYGEGADQKLARFLNHLHDVLLPGQERAPEQELYTGLLLGIGIGLELTGPISLENELRKLFGGGQDEQGS